MSYIKFFFELFCVRRPVYQPHASYLCRMILPCMPAEEEFWVLPKAMNDNGG